MTNARTITDSQINTKLVKAIENKVGHITKIHCEAKGYAVKLFKDDSWVVLPFNFINDAAGLGYLNYSLLK